MNSKKEQPSPTQTSPQPKNRRPASPPRTFTAMEKAQAVLAVWTERCKPADACRQMNVSWIVFNQWQTRAMEGMLQALENRVNLSRGEALSPRLQALLERRQQSLGVSKLSLKLEQLRQKTKAPQPAPETV